MEKEFVPYELAVKLKELGFDEECLGRFEYNVLVLSRSNQIGKRKFLQAPLWQQAFDWFRIEHGYDLFFKPMSFCGVTCYYDIEIQHPKYVWDTLPKVTGKTYEQTRLVCLEKLIEIVSQKPS